MRLQRLREDYSLEITAKDLSRLAAASVLIPRGSQVSITFLPGNKVADLAEVAAAVGALGLIPVPHISARRLASERELTQFLGALAEAGACERVFVVSGDPAQAMGPYEDALAVIRSGHLVRFGVRQVGIGGYPEGHPAIASEKLWEAMRDKVEAIGGAGQRAEIMTQFAFDADAVARWVGEVRERGVDVPIRIGLPGPTSVQSLIRFAARCGVAASGAILSKYGISITKLLSTATPDALIRALDGRLGPEHGSVGLHLYPFGGVEKTADWATGFFSQLAAA